MSQSKKVISVIGLGYVGLPLAILASKKGYKIIGVIKDLEKVELINKKTSPIKDDEISRGLKKTNIKATVDFSEIKKASIIIICVPTPLHDNQTPDLGPLINACENIGKNLKKGQTVILESTVNPGVSEDVILPLLEKESGLKGGKDFYLAHCPERINPGDPKWNVENINRVIGSLEEKGLVIASDFYKSILKGSIKQMDSLKEAEAVKIVENAFRDINIAFVNELALSFSHLGIDVTNVIDGAATKPFAFMAHYPGCGVGGHCIPVDPYYLIEYAKEKDFYHEFLALARRINNRMPKYTAELVVKGLNEIGISIRNTKVAVLGLSYKPNVGDDRESPSYKIINYLKEYSANVSTFDPFIPEKSTTKSLEEVLKGAKAVLLATGHDQFRTVTPNLLSSLGVVLIVDGRNFFNKEDFIKHGIIYKGVGR